MVHQVPPSTASFCIDYHCEDSQGSAVQFLKGQKNAFKDQIFFLQQIKKKLLL